MTGISLAHKCNTFRKHTKKLKSLWISVKLHGKAGTSYPVLSSHYNVSLGLLLFTH